MNFLGNLKLASASCSWYQLAKNSKKKKEARWLRRPAVESHIQSQYNGFDLIISNSTTHPVMSKHVRVGKLLREFYLAPSKTLKVELATRRKDHGLLECPYCGSPKVPDTLDHFLPKEAWPEYAIFPNNLVPQCRGCAPIKGQRYYCKVTKQALFLHPIYNADVSSVQFKIDISIVNDKQQFEITFTIDRAIQGDARNRVVVHLRELHVIQRMQTFCYRYYSHWKRKRAEEGIDIIVAMKAAVGPIQIGQVDGKNWKIAFMLGALRNPDVAKDFERVKPQSPNKVATQRDVLVV